MPQGLLLFLSNQALFLLRKAPNNPRQKTAAKQARIIPIMSITTVRKWGGGENISILLSQPSQVQNWIQFMHKNSRSEANPTKNLHPRLLCFVSLCMESLSQSPGTYYSLLPTLSSLNCRRKDKICLGESGKPFTEEGMLEPGHKGHVGIAATHRDGAERKAHTKAGRSSTFEELQRVWYSQSIKYNKEGFVKVWSWYKTRKFR